MGGLPGPSAPPPYEPPKARAAQANGGPLRRTLTTGVEDEARPLSRAPSACKRGLYCAVEDGTAGSAGAMGMSWHRSQC